MMLAALSIISLVIIITSIKFLGWIIYGMGRDLDYNEFCEAAAELAKGRHCVVGRQLGTFGNTDALWCIHLQGVAYVYDREAAGALAKLQEEIKRKASR